jgi:hypothetical protein
MKNNLSEFSNMSPKQRKELDQRMKMIRAGEWNETILYLLDGREVYAHRVYITDTGAWVRGYLRGKGENSSQFIGEVDEVLNPLDVMRTYH